MIPRLTPGARHLLIPGAANDRLKQQALDFFLDHQTQEGLTRQYVALLRDCGNRHALAEGKHVHSHIIKTGYTEDLFLANHLILMYDKCGSATDARHVFDEMPLRNLVSWNAMIGTYARNGQTEEAFKLFQQLQLEDLEPDIVTFVSILNACASPDAFALGKLLHAHVVWRRVQSHVVVGSALVNMYRRSGNIQDARELFDRMPERDVIVWNAMIGAYSGNGNSKEAFKLFEQMLQEGMQPDKITFISILKACNSPEKLEMGKQLHTFIIHDGHESDVVVGNALLNMYRKCGSMHAARRFFDRMPERNLISWNTIIGGYAGLGYGEEAFKLICQLQQQDLMPDKITFASILNTFASSGALALGKLVHGLIIDVKVESEVIVGNALISMYGKCGSIEDACRMFDKMVAHDVVSWTAIIAAYSEHGYPKEAFKLFQQMQHEGVKPDKVTFIGILNACTDRETLAWGRLVHLHIVDIGFESDLFVGTALVYMYGKCGSVDDARKVFDKMPQRNVVSWNVMIATYIQLGYDKEGFNLFQQMQQEGLKPDKITLTSVLNACANMEALAAGKLVHALILDGGMEADVVVGNILVGMYGKFGSIDDACRVFDCMLEKDVVSWNSIIASCCKHGHTEQAFKLFCQMHKEGIKPDKITFISILNVCASPEALELGKLFHTHIIATGIESDVVVGNALVNMYAKCGSVEHALNTFQKMPQRNVVSWTSMIAAFAHHGCTKEALDLFQEMQRDGVKPDKITLVSVLNACSHAGLVNEGLKFFESMRKDYGITPLMEHYNCVVDLLGRAGQLNKAEEFIHNMPFQPDAVIWITLLGACRTHCCIEQGRRAAEYAVQLNPQLSSAYVVLSNIYSSVGRWDDAAKMRKLMGDRAVKKEAGRSWIEVNSRVHEFVVRDKSHPQTKEIYAELARLSKVMEDEGYVPDTNLVLHDVEEEQKISLLCHHSEKLAIVYGLISIPCGTSLCITKNLRVCPDCHTATKFISKIARRKIVVRDASHFHHFKDGACSCGDYW